MTYPYAEARTKKQTRGCYKSQKDYGISRDTLRLDAAKLSTLPDRPCARCGARGWCGHRANDLA